jgi:hypothetical protein
MLSLSDICGQPVTGRAVRRSCNSNSNRSKSNAAQRKPQADVHSRRQPMQARSVRVSVKRCSSRCIASCRCGGHRVSVGKQSCAVWMDCPVNGQAFSCTPIQHFASIRVTSGLQTEAAKQQRQLLRTEAGMGTSTHGRGSGPVSSPGRDSCIAFAAACTAATVL